MIYGISVTCIKWFIILQMVLQFFKDQVKSAAITVQIFKVFFKNALLEKMGRAGFEPA